MTKVFITGATGFIGGNLVSGLLSRGYSVKILARSKRLLNLHPWKEKVEVVYGDITEPESFEKSVSDCEIFIHDAAWICFWNKKWDLVHKINVLGTKNMVDVALKAKCKKFIHVSSVAAIGYGENGESVNEDIEYNWDKLSSKIVYMETKRDAESEVYKGIKNGLNATFVNPANVWGINDFRGRRVRLIKAIKYGFPFYLEGGSNFVDVDAVCEATLNAIEKGRVGERYILGGENLSVKDFLGTIALGIKARKPFIKVGQLSVTLFAAIQEALALVIPFEPKPSFSQLPIFGKGIYYDSSKAVRELNMLIIPFSETIQKSIKFYKNHGLL